MARVVATALAEPLRLRIFVNLFAPLAMAVRVYTVVSRTVTRRRSEIGARKALGAGGGVCRAWRVVGTVMVRAVLAASVAQWWRVTRVSPAAALRGKWREGWSESEETHRARLRPQSQRQTSRLGAPLREGNGGSTGRALRVSGGDVSSLGR